MARIAPISSSASKCPGCSCSTCSMLARASSGSPRLSCRQQVAEERRAQLQVDTGRAASGQEMDACAGSDLVRPAAGLAVAGSARSHNPITVCAADQGKDSTLRGAQLAGHTCARASVRCPAAQPGCSSTARAAHCSARQSSPTSRSTCQAQQGGTPEERTRPFATAQWV